MAGTIDAPRASLQLVVDGIETAREELARHGAEVSGIQVLDPRDGGKFCFFADPDGNHRAVPEARQRVGAPPG